MGQDIDRLKTTLRPLMAGIVAAFGNHCEVVLHDLTRPERSIVWITPLAFVGCGRPARCQSAKSQSP